MNKINIQQVRVRDPFWDRHIQNAIHNVLPYQWRTLNDLEPDATPSHAMKNFRIAAGEEEGEFHGFLFQDSDLAKWIEAASYSLIYESNPEIEQNLSDAIALIKKAQREDGYFNTYYLLKQPDMRWKNIAMGHELYVTGHMLEAAVAYYQVTGKDDLLIALKKNIELIRSVFGPGKLDTFPGHEEIELALVKAYRATDEKEYLELAEYFIQNRGRVPGFREEEGFRSLYGKHHAFDESYYQAHAPIQEQEAPEGHAVRAMYFFSGAADVAKETGDKGLFEALDRLWDRTAGRRMYITGGVGSQGDGERFTIDYDLPNDTCYTETCAAIGLAMWGHRMLQLAPDRKYADVMERALYNNVLSGINLNGDRYFYVNPLMLKPDVAHCRADHSSVEPSRVKWFGCACCPPNVARTLCGFGAYIYTRSGDDVYQHLYVGNESKFLVENGEASLLCETEMPWTGRAKITCQGGGVRLHLRIPAYAENFRLTLNGGVVAFAEQNGYAALPQPSADGDVIEVRFDIKTRLIKANPRVTEDCGRIALTRGPFVYCAEEADNGPMLNDFRFDPSLPVTEEQDGCLGDSVILRVQGLRRRDNWQENKLYREYSISDYEPAEFRLIPYYLWNNRGEGEMLVWMHHLVK